MNSRGPIDLETPILIVGGGPVGLTLAMDLASRGIAVVVAEQRHRDEHASVKCNHVSARSMEIFRRLGMAARVRDSGLPPDYPTPVGWPDARYLEVCQAWVGARE